MFCFCAYGICELNNCYVISSMILFKHVQINNITFHVLYINVWKNCRGNKKIKNPESPLILCTKHRTKINKTKNTTQNIKKMSNLTQAFGKKTKCESRCWRRVRSSCFYKTQYSHIVLLFVFIIYYVTMITEFVIISKNECL